MFLVAKCKSINILHSFVKILLGLIGSFNAMHISSSLSIIFSFIYFDRLFIFVLVVHNGITDYYFLSPDYPDNQCIVLMFLTFIF